MLPLYIVGRLKHSSSCFPFYNSLTRPIPRLRVRGVTFGFSYRFPRLYCGGPGKGMKQKKGVFPSDQGYGRGGHCWVFVQIFKDLLWWSREGDETKNSFAVVRCYSRVRNPPPCFFFGRNFFVRLKKRAFYYTRNGNGTLKNEHTCSRQKLKH